MLVPVLALLFGVDIRYAIGASLVSVIATSSGSAASYVKEGYSNIRVGMLLEIATTLGALIGAFLATHVSTQTIAIIFGLVLLYSAYQSFFDTEQQISESQDPDRLATRLKLNGDYPVGSFRQHYCVQNVPTGFGLMIGAGTLSGLLGIGSGAVKGQRAVAVDLQLQQIVLGVERLRSAGEAHGAEVSEGRHPRSLAVPSYKRAPEQRDELCVCRV